MEIDHSLFLVDLLNDRAPIPIFAEHYGKG